MFSNDDALVAALKANNIDAIEDGAADCDQDAARSRASRSRRPRRRPDRLHLQLEPEEAEEPRAAQPAGPRAPSTTRSTAHRSSTSSSSAPRSRRRRSSRPRRAPGTTRPQADDVRPRAWRTRSSTRSATSAAPDGIRVANGHKMSYTVITPTDLSSVNRTFQIIQADFHKIGVQLNQKALDSSAAFDAITAAERQVPRTSTSRCGTGSR